MLNHQSLWTNEESDDHHLDMTPRGVLERDEIIAQAVKAGLIKGLVNQDFRPVVSDAWAKGLIRRAVPSESEI